MPSASIMFARCTETVFTLRVSWSAISLFDFPSTINCGDVWEYEQNGDSCWYDAPYFPYVHQIDAPEYVAP